MHAASFCYSLRNGHGENPNGTFPFPVKFPLSKCHSLPSAWNDFLVFFFFFCLLHIIPMQRSPKLAFPKNLNLQRTLAASAHLWDLPPLASLPCLCFHLKDNEMSKPCIFDENLENSVSCLIFSTVGFLENSKSILLTLSYIRPLDVNWISQVSHVEKVFLT